jgi:hypothetical protein
MLLLAALGSGSGSAPVLGGLPLLGAVQAPPRFEHLSLSSPSGGLSATVFLPARADAAPDAQHYYGSSRFDWSSMIGELTTSDGHVLAADNFWRAPHDPAWTESGIGLAGEFGCGDDGSACGPGWGAYDGAGGVPLTNGVLGYDEAVAGGSFLKIGVGALRKGSCAGCDATSASDRYRFNSPYAFDRTPEWTVTRRGPGEVRLESNASLPAAAGHAAPKWGYALARTVALTDGPARSPLSRSVGGLLVETWELTNTGSEAFATPYYSHNFFALDAAHIAAGWTLQVDGLHAERYTDGDASWAKPLGSYARARPSASGLSDTLEWEREVRPAEKLKANFEGAACAFAPPGDFRLSYDGGAFSVRSTQCLQPPQLQAEAAACATECCQPRLYAFNLYAEATTLSPEPIVRVELQPKQTAVWTRTLALDSTPPPVERGARRGGEDARGANERARAPPPALAGSTDGAARAGAEPAPAHLKHLGLACVGGLLFAGMTAALYGLFVLQSPARNFRNLRARGANAWPQAAINAAAASAGLSDDRAEAECELLSAEERTRM